MTERSYPVTEQEFLEDNIATVAWHIGRPGATMKVDHGVSGLNVSEGEVLQEIARRLSNVAKGSAGLIIALERVIGHDPKTPGLSYDTVGMSLLFTQQYVAVMCESIDSMQITAKQKEFARAVMRSAIEFANARHGMYASKGARDAALTSTHRSGET